MTFYICVIGALNGFAHTAIAQAQTFLLPLARTININRRNPDADLGFILAYQSTKQESHCIGRHWTCAHFARHYFFFDRRRSRRLEESAHRIIHYPKYCGASDGVSTIIRNTIRQLQTPDHIRGRMTSVSQIFFQGGPQLGEVEAGSVAQLLGAPFAVISGGIGCIVGMFLIVWKWPQLIKYSGDEPTLAGVLAD